MDNRYIDAALSEYCFAYDKIALISGPRQVGKTYLARQLLKQRCSGSYHNWDDEKFRLLWARTQGFLVEDLAPSPGQKPLLVLDEIHKDRAWKRKVKGLYDTLPGPVDIVVTGSAKLNVFRKKSDSLFGRHFHFHLHPLSAGELLGSQARDSASFRNAVEPANITCSSEADQIIDDFLRFSTFPEPYLRANPRFLNTWRRSRAEQIIREDLRDISAVQEISHIELMLPLLMQRVGSLAGRASIRESLEVSFDSVRRWMDLLSQVYFIFTLHPYQKSLSRALRRERKVYLWEPTGIPEPGAKFENIVALHLLKACHFWSDTGEGDFTLHFLRTKDKAEIDFLICKDGRPWLPIEVKSGELNPSPHWRTFMPALACPLGIQLVMTPGVKKVYRENNQTLLVVSAGAVLQYL